MSDLVLLGPDRAGLLTLLEAAGFESTALDGNPVGADLEAAGIADASVLLLTDVGHASMIPVARELNPGLLVVLYTGAGLPAFASAQADLSVDPDLVGAADLVEAVADRVAAAG